MCGLCASRRARGKTVHVLGVICVTVHVLAVICVVWWSYALWCALVCAGCLLSCFLCGCCCVCIKQQVPAAERRWLMGRDVIAGSLDDAVVVALDSSGEQVALRYEDHVLSANVLAVWLAHVASFMASSDASQASTLPSLSPPEVSTQSPESGCWDCFGTCTAPPCGTPCSTERNLALAKPCSGSCRVVSS